MTTVATIDAVWAAARAGEWTRWPGLPPGLSAAQVVAALTGAPPPLAVAARLGRRMVDRHDAAAIHAWTERDAAILVEWIDPPCAGPVAELLAALGPPGRDAAGRHLRAGATTTEYVYPDRGLALTVAASYDQPPSFAP
ncbi:MAG TPA: hypothetical protein VK607_10225, partial [Kofleriaceae bacterium]|nr:hypothetical protein [Kofleriaceae bacterium]